MSNNSHAKYNFADKKIFISTGFENVDSVGYKQTEDTLIIKKAFMGDGYLTLLLPNKHNQNVETDIEVSFVKTEKQDQCPLDCEKTGDGYCNNGTCQCDKKTGRLCEKDINIIHQKEKKLNFNKKLEIPPFASINFATRSTLHPYRDLFVNIAMDHKPNLQVSALSMKGNTQKFEKFIQEIFVKNFDKDAKYNEDNAAIDYEGNKKKRSKYSTNSDPNKIVVKYYFKKLPPYIYVSFTNYGDKVENVDIEIIGSMKLNSYNNSRF